MADNRDENPYVFESEVLSPFARLRPGESYTWRYEWAACRIGGDCPVVDCSQAGLVSEPLASQRQDGRVRLRGRLGVFQAGRLVLEAYDEKARLLTTEILAPTATPLTPVVLDLALDLLPATRSVTIVLQDAEGKRIGQSAQAAVSGEAR